MNKDTKCCDGYPHCYCNEMASELEDDEEEDSNGVRIIKLKIHPTDRPFVARIPYSKPATNGNYDLVSGAFDATLVGGEVDEDDPLFTALEEEIKLSGDTKLRCSPLDKPIVNPIHYNDVPETKEEIDRMWQITKGMCK